MIESSIPEIGRHLLGGPIVFPLLWIAASFGPVVVTAFEVGRRVWGMISSVNWGLALVSSSLVGRHLGAGDEEGARAYGGSVIKLSVLLHVALACLVILLATPIARVFVTAPDQVVSTAVIVSVGAVSAVGWGIDATASEALLRAGDTRWPLVTTVIDRYAFALPVAVFGLYTPLGVAGFYVALLLNMFVPAGVNYWWFRSDRWKIVSRRYRPSTDAW